MKIRRKKEKEPEKIRATREQAQRLAADAEKAARNATKRFRQSIIIFVFGLLPIGVLGVYGTSKITEGNIKNTLLFIITSVTVCTIFVLYLSQNLDRKYDGLTNTIHNKGLSRKLKP
jgi:hypothetical protein